MLRTSINPSGSVYTNLQLALFKQIQCCFDVRFLDHIQWILYRSCPLEQELEMMYLLSLRTRKTTERGRYSSYDNTRTINKEILHSFQPNNNTNYDPITKSGLALQPRQKVVHFNFVTSICSLILSCLWNSSERSLSSKQVTSVHLKKSQCYVSGQIKNGTNKWGNQKRLERGRHAFEDFELFGYHSCKNFCSQLKKFHLLTVW